MHILKLWLNVVFSTFVKKNLNTFIVLKCVKIREFSKMLVVVKCAFSSYMVERHFLDTCFVES